MEFGEPTAKDNKGGSVFFLHCRICPGNWLGSFTLNG